MKKVIAMLLAVLLVAAALTACGSKDAPSGSAGQGSQSSSASQQETVTVPPVENFTGVVEEIEPEKNRVSVMVSMFGRETPVDLELDQVEVQN